MSLKVTAWNKAHDRFEDMKPPKTLIISGVYKSNKTETEYNVTLFGQSETELNCVYIKSMKHTGSYHSLTEAAKKSYCHYFDTDDNNLITLDSLIEK